MRAALALALALALAACGGSDGGGDGDNADATPTPAGPVAISGGETAVRLDGQIRTALSLVGASVEPTSGATGSAERLAFPISGGEILPSNRRGRVEHRGGLRIALGGRAIEAGDLAVVPQDGTVSAVVSGRRVPLFAAKLRPRGDLRTADPMVLEGPLLIAGGGALDQALKDLGLGTVVGDAPIGRIAVRAQRG